MASASVPSGNHDLRCSLKNATEPGYFQIMSAIGMMQEAQAGDDPERIRECMSGNLCRCGAYAGIVDAVLEVQTSQTMTSQRRSA